MRMAQCVHTLGAEFVFETGGHNLYELVSHAALDACNFTGSMLIFDFKTASPAKVRDPFISCVASLFNLSYSYCVLLVENLATSKDVQAPCSVIASVSFSFYCWERHSAWGGPRIYGLYRVKLTNNHHYLHPILLKHLLYATRCSDVH